MRKILLTLCLFSCNAFGMEGGKDGEEMPLKPSDPSSEMHNVSLEEEETQSGCWDAVKKGYLGCEQRVCPCVYKENSSFYVQPDKRCGIRVMVVGGCVLCCASTGACVYGMTNPHNGWVR